MASPRTPKTAPAVTPTTQESIEAFLSGLGVSSVAAKMSKTKDTKNTKRFDTSSEDLDCIYIPNADVRKLGNPHKVMVIVVNIDDDPD